MLITPPVSDKAEFERSNNLTALQRIRMLSTLAFILCGAAVLVLLPLWVAEPQRWLAPLTIQGAILLSAVLLFSGSGWILARPYHQHLAKIMLHTCMVALMTLCLAGSLMRLHHGQDIYLFITLLLFFCFICPFRPAVSLTYLAVGGCVFFWGLAYINITPGDRQALILNVSVTMAVIWVISISLYRGAVADFITRIRLRERERAFRKMFLFNPQPLMVINLEDGRVVLANSNARLLYGIPYDELPTLYAGDFFARPEDWEEMYAKVRQTGTLHNHVTEHIAATGQHKWVMVGLEMMDYDGQEALLCEVADVTELKRQEKVLADDAYTDALTGAMNRRRGMELASELVAQVQEKGGCFTLCFLDLNGLKKVNDCFGHMEGDFFIRTVCGVIEEEIDRADLFFRYGGDEFIILFPGITAEEAQMTCDRMKRRLDRLNRQRLCAYNLSISTGLCSFYKGDRLSLEEIIRQADQEMYKEKELAGDRCPV